MLCPKNPISALSAATVIAVMLVFAVAVRQMMRSSGQPFEQPRQAANCYAVGEGGYSPPRVIKRSALEPVVHSLTDDTH
jgi:hypothetical protein